MTRRILLVWTALFVTLGAMAQKELNGPGKLRDFDLLFVVAQQPNAITDVTQGAAGYEVEHVGVFLRENGVMKVIEAVYEGVREIEYEQFSQDASCILVGRLSKSLDKQKTRNNLKELVGRPYDFVFLPGSDAIYCSELVSESYVDKKGRQVFSPVPMSFHDESNNVTPYWKDFYSRRGMDVPEGKPGTNPGELSRRENVKIKYMIRNFAK